MIFIINNGKRKKPQKDVNLPDVIVVNITTKTGMEFAFLNNLN
jgi:hypothetical protein